MNIFGFNTVNAIISLIYMLLFGVFLGFFLGVVRYILFSFMETQPHVDLFGKGVKNL
jgi:NhaP-type Na+/H+ or K+/H+ antiporter